MDGGLKFPGGEVAQRSLLTSEYILEIGVGSFAWDQGDPQAVRRAKSVV